MNILIVDDNKNNRMIIRLLLEDYMEDNSDANFHMEEAGNGQEAVDMCNKSSFDIVLMDIMMPIMDGIEATKIIRETDKKIMIIAVSAVDDNDRKKLILNSGAEDYISKPINSDIFISRIQNYKTLVEARKHTKKHPSRVNLFSDEVYRRHTNFVIDSEDSLSEFWEFFLLNARAKYNHLSDVVRTIFAIADIQVRLSIECNIYIEESDELQYFTLTGIDKLPNKMLELVLKKNTLTCKYKSDDEKISFELYKNVLEVDEKIETMSVDREVNVEENIPQSSEPSEEMLASPVEYQLSSQELEVFDYLEDEDLNDLQEYARKLNSLMLIVGSGDVSEEEITDIYTYLDRMGSILATYSEVYPISKALSELSVDMSTHISVFAENSEALGPMCKAFSNDMSSWIEMSFHTGAPSIDFMNDTIVVNCQTIGGMLKMDEAPVGGEEDFDDIFDF